MFVGAGEGPAPFSSLVPQRFDRIDPRRPARGIGSREQADADSDAEGEADEPERGREEIGRRHSLTLHELLEYDGSDPGDDPSEEDSEGRADRADDRRFDEEERPNLTSCFDTFSTSPLAQTAGSPGTLRHIVPSPCFTNWRRLVTGL